METPFAYDPALSTNAGSFAGATDKPSKSASAYRTISEAADLLGVPQHVLRFWETKFPQIRPMKRSGGRRYYGPGDIETLRTIQNFLYEQGYTIKGVQRLLRLRRGNGGLNLPLAALDESSLNEELFDSAAVSEALMLDAPPPSMDMIAFGRQSEIDVTEIAPVMDAVQQTLDDLHEMDAAELVEIPSHLPSKPAALMAAGLEAGRPYPVASLMVEAVTVEAPVVETAVEAAPRAGLALSASKRQRLELLLGELHELKAMAATLS